MQSFMTICKTDAFSMVTISMEFPLNKLRQVCDMKTFTDMLLCCDLICLSC